MDAAVPVKRALLSCHDKSGLDTFARGLAALGIELIASGGTAETLRQVGITARSVEEFAGIREQLDGRVKTLHPAIHAGILALRDRQAHRAQVAEAGLIDMVIVSLYPFAATVQRAGVSWAEAVEQIDIGGVALLRAAGKNFAHVVAVSSPSQYAEVLHTLREHRGTLPAAMSRRLAAQAFALTQAYDGLITSFLGEGNGAWPEVVTLALRRQEPLRYGENPHQPAAWYVPAAESAWGLGTLQSPQGKVLSYNNLLDVDTALRALVELREPGCVIVKHRAPCGLALGANILAAYERALACDPESAFGGIVGVNRSVDAALAERMAATFLEVVLAPAVEATAQEILRRKQQLRVVTLAWPATPPASTEWRQLWGAWLAQRPDAGVEDTAQWRVVTQRAPSERERKDLAFAWQAAKAATSNGIVLARDGATVGIGQGQPSRVGSVRVAIEKAGAAARGAVAASDGFFPFPDSVERLARAGVTAVVQPGGSVRDAEVTAAADRLQLAMCVTGVRHFRH